MVIGDLTKEDAEVYWRERLLHHAPGVPFSPDFKTVYRVCGGNIYLLKKFFHECILKEGRLKLYPEEFSRVVEAKAKLSRAINRGRPDDTRIWNNEQFFAIIKKLTDSKGAFLYYDHICEEFGEHIIDALISHNVLHLRPTISLSNDFPGHNTPQPVVTAENQCNLIAMNKIVAKLLPTE